MGNPTWTTGLRVPKEHCHCPSSPLKLVAEQDPNGEQKVLDQAKLKARLRGSPALGSLVPLPPPFPVHSNPKPCLEPACHHPSFAPVFFMFSCSLPLPGPAVLKLWSLTSRICTIRGLVSNASFSDLTPDFSHQTLEDETQQSLFLKRLPGDSDACSSWRTTDLDYCSPL